MSIHSIVDGRFVCTADATAKCHTYPACECESWTREVHGQEFGEVIGFSNGRTLYAAVPIDPMPGHETVQHDECWLQGWMEAGPLWESYEPEDVAYDDGDFPDGPIDYTWHGDYLTWKYDGPMRPQFAQEDAS